MPQRNSASFTRMLAGWLALGRPLQGATFYCLNSSSHLLGAVRLAHRSHAAIKNHQRSRSWLHSGCNWIIRVCWNRWLQKVIKGLLTESVLIMINANVNIRRHRGRLSDRISHAVVSFFIPLLDWFSLKVSWNIKIYWTSRACIWLHKWRVTSTGGWMLIVWSGSLVREGKRKSNGDRLIPQPGSKTTLKQISNRA